MRINWDAAVILVFSVDCFEILAVY